MKLCIIGGGPGAMAMAARARQAGHEVGLLELARFQKNIQLIRDRKALRSSGMIEGRFDLVMATCEPQEALSWADMALVVTHAAAHGEIAPMCADYLAPGKPVILCPAYVGGGWRFARRLARLRPASGWPLLECSVLPFACRKPEADLVSVHGIKRSFIVSKLGRGDAAPALDLMAGLFEGARPSLHPLEAGLHETNFIIHPCIALANFSRVEEGRDWTFYRQGISEGIGRLIQAVDAERCAILEKMQLSPVSLVQWFQAFYGDQGMKGETIYQMLSGFSPFAGSKGPLSLGHRYFTEDIPYGLVPMRQIGEALGISLPLTESLINLAGTMCRQDFEEGGDSMADIVLP